jgi:hypothetical protein
MTNIKLSGFIVVWLKSLAIKKNSTTSSKMFNI